MTEGGNYNLEKTTRGSFDARSNAIKDRLTDERLLLLDRDREIVGQVIDKLGVVYKESGRQTEAVEALGALDFLVPRIGEKERRQIGNISVSPGLEKTIKSRAGAREVDVMSDEGGWGELPEEVKEEVMDKSNMMVEVTDKCTVKCEFCGLAKKGPIKTKMEYESLVDLMEDWKENRRYEVGSTKSDGLYWGTDPFDMRWVSDGKDLDYLDVARAYSRVFKNKGSYLYTSTAVPVGEELRVLNFALNFVEGKKNGDFLNEHAVFRISKTQVNQQRVEAIDLIMKTLNEEDSLKEVTYEVTDNRSDNPSLAGSRWKDNLTTVSDWDVMGPNCRDDIVISPQVVRGVVMEGASNERPVGESRHILGEELGGGKKRYLIPHHQEKPIIANGNPEDFYPDAVFTEIIVDSDGQITSKEIVDDENPHRALLRIVGTISHYCDPNGPEALRWSFNKLTGKQKGTIREKIRRKDIKLIREHMEELKNQGKENISMSMFMDFFEKEGIVNW